MPKLPSAITSLPPATLSALEQLGANLAVARLRRGESLKTWAKRLGVSIPTLQRLEAGDPGVAVGIVASGLWLIGRDSALAELAAPEHDRGALELDVRAANELGKTRAQTSAERRLASPKAKRAKSSKD